jgi:maleylacetoacetate isomerase
MFRGKDNALQPNWLHLPVGYHGRSSTVVVSGTPVCRPCGQLQKDKDDPSLGSVYGSCQLLDFELEMAAVVGGPANCLGQPLTLEQAKDRIFGFMLMNDWSARDIQKWEYVPLGPFTAKNFATTVSPWIVMAEALDVVPATAQTDPVPLEYLRDSEPAAYNVELTVAIQSKDQSEAHVVCHSNFTNMYWNAAQQLVHHSVSGCVMRAGDLLGSGTISGSTEDSYGSMLELSWKGSKEVKVGEEFRKFLKDDDTVMMRGLCVKDGMGRVGFGECDGQIRPAITTEGDVTPTQPILLEDRFIDFKLYGYWRSSSTWRVRVLLAAKDVQYTTVPVNLLKGENRTEEFLAKNPLGQIPLLECTDTATGETVCLAQSVAIMEFLEGIFPTRRSLMPSDPVDKGVALEMAEAINAGTQPLQNIFFLRKLEEISDGKINASEMAKEANERGLRVLESLVKRRHEKVKGPFCLGTFSPSFVDACMVPQIYNARRFGVDVLEVCPRLAEIEALCSKHAWFKASHPNVQPDAVVE